MMKNRTTRVLQLAGSVLCAGAIGFATSATVQDDAAANRIDAARAVQEQRAETLRLISEEKAAWITGRAILEDSIALVGQEIEGLRASIADSREAFTQTQGKVVELEEENERLEASLAGLDGTIAEAESRLRGLVALLPEPIVERLEGYIGRIPDDPTDTKLLLRERFATVVTIVNEIDKFNREITTRQEVRELEEDGKAVAVTALYVGIGQAYCANAERTLAWIGTVGEESWVWVPHHQHAAAIAEAIDVAEGSATAAFVSLPTVIK